MVFTRFRSTQTLSLLERSPRLLRTPELSFTQKPISVDPNRFSLGHSFQKRVRFRVLGYVFIIVTSSEKQVNENK